MTPKVYPHGVTYHPAVVCERDGYACPFHNPSDHHMVEWPIVVRISTLVERRCVHGVGHPDPDSVRHLVRKTGDTHWSTHGCDGCCLDPNKGALHPAVAG